MSHELLLWLHVLTFALWFGTDLGVFTASLATTDPKQSVAVRRYAMQLLMKLDLSLWKRAGTVGIHVPCV